ncbi:dTDP-4-dehydrorhamnose reductase, partial [Pseudomonas aeruginosa]
RPANSRRDHRKLKKVFGLVLPDWPYHAGRMLQELSQQGPL